MKRKNLTLPRRRYGCPTCGNHWLLRNRRGGIARIMAAGVPWGRGGLPKDSIRVYWPPWHGSKTLRVCPDPWHKPPEHHPNETFTTMNVHARPARLQQRRKSKARRHKDHQGKDRR